MVTPTQQRDKQPGRLDWTYSLDLTVLDSSSQIDEVWTLTGRWWHGRQVTVRIGDIGPHDLDSRVPYGLGEALRLGVSITLDGTPRAVRAWWEAIHPEPKKPVPHLHLVGAS